MSFYYSCKKCGVALDLEAEIPELLCPSCQEPMTLGAPPAAQAPSAPAGAAAPAAPAIKVARVVSGSASAAMTGRKPPVPPPSTTSTTGHLKTATASGTATAMGRPPLKTTTGVVTSSSVRLGAASSSAARLATAAAGQEADGVLARAKAEAAGILQNARSQAQMIIEETQRQAAHMRSAAEAEATDLRRVAEAQAGMAAGGMVQQFREASEAQAKGILAEAQAKADEVQRMLAKTQADFEAQMAEKRRTAEAEIAAMKSGAGIPAAAPAATKPAAPKSNAMKMLAEAEAPGLSEADRAVFQKRKAEMNAAAKREAQMIMFCLINSFVGLLYVFGVLAMVRGKSSGLVAISVMAMLADLGFLGYMGALIMKHYKQSRDALASHQERMAAARAVLAANPPAGKPAGKPLPGKGSGAKPA